MESVIDKKYVVIEDQGIKKLLDSEKGKIAVIVTETFGSGWSTWCDDEIRETILFDPEIAFFLIKGEEEKITEEYLQERFGLDFYVGSGAESLVVKWVKQFSLFYIKEYDGAETLITQDHFTKA